MRKYSDEMDKMQQEALRRMQEMQSRGKPVAVSNTTNAEQSQEKKQASPISAPDSVPIHKKPEICNTENKQPSFFESIFHDKERSLILLLLLLLSTEKTDTGLILALVYLLI
ncbi:MAG: hypothetical protein UHY68_07235 [Acutalibacteraceae bacterium]|nr:hypothetical protein [Acutalibacteraceae bacterium]